MATRFLPASHAAAVRAAEALEALIPDGELKNNPAGAMDHPATHADMARIANALESLVIDRTPTEESGHLVTSGGVKAALDATVRSVNFISPDENGDVPITHVLTADNLTADDAQDIYGAFAERTTGGTVSITDGESWLGLIEGNSVRTGYVHESRNYEYTAGEREADPETGIVPDILSVSMNWNTFISAVSGASTTMTISYDGEAWNYTPGTYGLTVDGTPVEGDSIAIAYVPENRGTITNATPSSFVSTGWNLYNDSVGYARVLKYSDTYGFKVGGTYTSLAFSTTIDGDRTTITPDANGLFTIAEDGYVYVVGGNDTDTYVIMTWSDWGSGYDGSFAAYTESTVDFSSIMTQNFPNGLCSVGAVRDDIDFSNQTAHVRIERMAYSAENIATLEAAGRAYWYDDDYIYAVLDTPVAVAFTLANQVDAYDHGMEGFADTQVPVYAHVLYGQNLKDKLRTDVLTISEQSLTDAQKEQVRKNAGTVSANSVAIVADGNTHAAVASGQYVYVRGHSTLAEGLYKATTAIAANAALTSSNVTAVNGGLGAEVATLSSNVSAMKSSSYATFSSIPSDFIGFCRVSPSNPATKDSNAPYPSASAGYWNVIQFGLNNRLTQVATQVFNNYSGKGEIWTRSKHDSTWGSWNSPDAKVVTQATVSNAYCSLTYTYKKTGRIVVLSAKLSVASSITSTTGYLSLPSAITPLENYYAPMSRDDATQNELTARLMQISSSGIRFNGPYTAGVLYSGSISYISNS